MCSEGLPLCRLLSGRSEVRILSWTHKSGAFAILSCGNHPAFFYLRLIPEPPLTWMKILLRILAGRPAFSKEKIAIAKTSENGLQLRERNAPHGQGSSPHRKATTSVWNVENPDHIRRNPMIFRPFPDIIRSKMSKSQLRILSRSISVVVAKLSIR